MPPRFAAQREINYSISVEPADIYMCRPGQRTPKGTGFVWLHVADANGSRLYMGIVPESELHAEIAIAVKRAADFEHACRAAST